jgi:hypothetical protein
LFDSRRNVRKLARREAVLHLQDGETTIRGFLMDFFNDSLLVAKPVLLAPDDKDSQALGGEALVFHDQIKFIQVL